MPAFIYALLAGLASILPAIIWQLMISLGVGFVTFTGVSLAFESLHTFVVGNYSGLPSALLGVLGLMKIDQAFNLVLSACTARLTLQGLTGSGLRKMVFKAPA